MRLDGAENPTFRQEFARMFGVTHQDVAGKLGLTRTAITQWVSRSPRPGSFGSFLEEVLADIDVRAVEASVKNVLRRHGVDLGEKGNVVFIGDDEFLEL